MHNSSVVVSVHKTFFQYCCGFSVPCHKLQEGSHVFFSRQCVHSWCPALATLLAECVKQSISISRLVDYWRLSKGFRLALITLDCRSLENSFFLPRYRSPKHILLVRSNLKNSDCFFYNTSPVHHLQTPLKKTKLLIKTPPILFQQSAARGSSEQMHSAENENH